MEDDLPHAFKAHDENQKRKLAFVQKLRGAEQHWFFIQGMGAAENGLFVPAVSSLLNGLEATLRIYVHRFGNEGADWAAEPSAYRVLSNTLIEQAAEIGLPVEVLAFEGENDFNEKLHSRKPNKLDVELVKHRNNICHGNVQPYFITPYEGETIFIPEALSELYEQLLSISERWAGSLQTFRAAKAIL